MFQPCHSGSQALRKSLIHPLWWCFAFVRKTFWACRARWRKYFSCKYCRAVRIWTNHSTTKVIVKVSVTQSCPTLCDPMDYSPPGSSVHGILQARILEWVAIPFSRGSFRPRDQSRVYCIAGRFFTIWATGKAHHQALRQTLPPSLLEFLEQSTSFAEAHDKVQQMLPSLPRLFVGDSIESFSWDKSWAFCSATWCSQLRHFGALAFWWHTAIPSDLSQSPPHTDPTHSQDTEMPETTWY